MRLFEVIGQKIASARYQHKQPYKEVLKSISTDGTQYWDTGISNPSGKSFKFDIGFTPTFSSGTIIGNESNYTLIYRSSENINGSYFRVSGSISTPNDVYASIQAEYDATTYARKVTVNGTQYTGTGVLTANSETAKLFANTGHIPSDNGRGECHYAKIHIDGTMVRDMIPVLDWNDQPCFYDRVAKELLYANTQTGLTYERWNMVEVDYLQSSGSQYIDTGIVPGGKKIGAIVDFKFNTVSSNGGVTGSNNADGSDNIQFSVYSGKWRIKISNYATYGNNVDTDRHTVRLNMSDGTSLDDTVFTSTQYTIPNNNTNMIYLFRVNYNSASSDMYILNGKVYSAKYYNDTELIRDYIPCVINGTGYMYDRVENKLYANAGTGSFSAGIVIDGVDYKIGSSIQSSGSQYIDTGVNAQSGLDITLRFIAKQSSDPSAMFGGRQGAGVKNLAFFYLAGSVRRYDYNNTVSLSIGDTFIVDTEYTVECKDNECYIDGELKATAPQEEWSCANNVYLGGVNTNGTFQFGCASKYKYFSIAGRMELIPCQYTDANNNTVTTMLDLVSKAPLTPSGTFTFNTLGA